MSDYRRKNIINDYIAVLQKITTANGYNTDAGNNVTHWIRTPIDAGISNEIFLNVKDTVAEHSNEVYSGNYTPQLNVTVEIITKHGSDTYSQLLDVIADIYEVTNTEFYASLTTEYEDLMIVPLQDEIIDISKDDYIYGEAEVQFIFEFKQELTRH